MCGETRNDIPSLTDAGDSCMLLFDPHVISSRDSSLQYSGTDLQTSEIKRYGLSHPPPPPPFLPPPLKPRLPQPRPHQDRGPPLWVTQSDKSKSNICLKCVSGEEERAGGPAIMCTTSVQHEKHACWVLAATQPRPSVGDASVWWLMQSWPAGNTPSVTPLNRQRIRDSSAQKVPGYTNQRTTDNLIIPHYAAVNVCHYGQENVKKL
ncbi:hypothetical protein E2C01_063227 [Portunus trituberculatus]|uniref:Uncharacterized protein n=1 Tax=Portunus trituberculatus TaxID=210409 RepID=A0A5B7HK86_PORTR|nr:hypothetical protein [Portunus trituberculatus]